MHKTIQSGTKVISQGQEMSLKKLMSLNKGLFDTSNTFIVVKLIS